MPVQHDGAHDPVVKIVVVWQVFGFYRVMPFAF
jgi:hypothetical protein